jgi:hypothetical protein
MSVARDCQRYAARCLRDARETIDPRQKVFLIEMAQAWQRLAEREAKNQRSCLRGDQRMALTDFNAIDFSDDVRRCAVWSET